MLNDASGAADDPLVFPLLTAAEVGRDLLGGVPAKTVHLYAREGRLPCVWIGKHQRFNRPSVERTLQSLARTGRRL